MKQLVCELCGGSDLLKDGGIFVCQGCGCKYTLEEARKMMIEGTVDVSGSTVRIDNSPQVKNFLEIGNNALSAGNGQQAEIYANKALEIDPSNSDAWALKMMSYEHTATLGDPQVADVLAAGGNVIAYAQDKEAAEENTYRYYLERAKNLLLLSEAKMRDVADLKNTYRTFVLLSMLTAAENTAKADSKIFDIYNNLANTAALFTDAVPDSALCKYEGLADDLEECSRRYNMVTSAVQFRLDVYKRTLIPSALEARSKISGKMRERAEAGRKAFLRYQKEKKEKEDEEKRLAMQAKANAYWQENPDKKAMLEQQLAEIEKKCEELAEVRGSISDRISAAENECKAAHPEEEQLKKYNDMCRQKEVYLGTLGAFKGKEKKLVTAEIEELRQKKWALDRKIKEEKEGKMKRMKEDTKQDRDELGRIEGEIGKLVKEADALKNTLENPFEE